MARIGVVRPLNLHFSITPTIHSFALVSSCLLFALLILSPVRETLNKVSPFHRNIE